MGQAQVIAEPMYDPTRTYRENFEQGPFGLFAQTHPPQQAESPQHSFLGMAVGTPFGIPAGPLVNGKFVKAALDYGFDLPI
jgi:dihydroorotate dehydrogenase (NAD+) catalytic subunit